MRVKIKRFSCTAVRQIHKISDIPANYPRNIIRNY